MMLTYINDPFPHAIIENLYDDNELSLIWKELDFLTDKDKLLDEKKTGSAFTPDGEDLKRNYGIWMDSLYSNRKVSNILRFSRKIFDRALCEELCSKHWVFAYLLHSIRDTTLLSYYEDSHVYQSHIDYSSITVLTHLFREPKQFTGGDLVFGNDYMLPLTNNRAIIFPGIIPHAVTELKMETDDTFTGYGRYCISQFVQITKDTW